MKIYRPFLILIFVLVLTLLIGCSPASVAHSLDSAEDAIENRVDAAEDAIENRVDAVEDSAENAIKDALSDVPPQTDSTLTEEDAKAIALAHAGFTADQVKNLHAQFDRDRIDHYDVEFRHNGWEYDYEIDAATGEILSWDKDD